MTNESRLLQGLNSFGRACLWSAHARFIDGFCDAGIRAYFRSNSSSGCFISLHKTMNGLTLLALLCCICKTYRLLIPPLGTNCAPETTPFPRGLRRPIWRRLTNRRSAVFFAVYGLQLSNPKCTALCTRVRLIFRLWQPSNFDFLLVKRIR